MIMTAGAGYGQPKEAARGRVNLIVDNVVHVVIKHSSERQESERSEPPRFDGRLD